MGIVQAKHFRRRLVLGEKGYDEFMDQWLKDYPEAEKVAFRPFGGWNYSYDNAWSWTGSLIAWVFVTVGTLGVDWREAAILLGGSLWAQETVKKNGLNLFKENYEDGWFTMGCSWVFNVQLGYLVYHVLFKGNKRWLVWLASGWVGAGNIYGLTTPDLVDNDAHAEGFVVGIAAAFLLDFVFKKRKALV